MRKCLKMPKKWEYEELRESGVMPCSKAWLAKEKLEKHKFKIGSAGWRREERRERAHKKR